MDTGIECTLSNSGDDKLSGATDTLEGRDSIQRDPDRFESWACAVLVHSTRPSVKSCAWVGVIPNTDTGWVMSGLKAALWKKTSGCWWAKNWT